ncbi:MAG: VOC family protein [Oscillospiraceae bacterium]|nr:VOC family protein [Oscillospiraceae bacterium]
MKIDSQIYAVGSIEAVEMYRRAFGAEISFEVKNDDGTYLHCELSVDGQHFISVSEAGDNCEKETVYPWRTMAFNVHDMGSKEAVDNAFAVLSENGTIIDDVGPCDWNEYCANVIDKFGAFWWIAI